jgi:hypothetical protein
MRVGSEEHKELFCGSFIATHLAYEPTELPWPALDDVSLARLRAIPIWSIALQVELNAGEMVTGFAATLRDPLIRAAVALEGAEETRHARMVGALVERYGLSATTYPPNLPHTEAAFVNFGYRECVDSLLGFGLFRLARKVRFLPDALVSLFTRILAEEARHIVFFVNWIAYERAQRGYGFAPLEAAAAALGYGRALVQLVQAGREAAGGTGGFNDDDVFGDLTMAKFLAVCLAENDMQLERFDGRLLRPRLLPRLAAIALGALTARGRFGAAAQTRLAHLRPGSRNA